MKRHVALILTVVIAVVIVLAAVCPPLTQAQNDSPRDAAWRADLATLAAELPQRHVAPFAKVSQADFEAAVADLDAAIPALTDEQITVRLMQLVAMIGDAHTALGLNITADTLVFPLSFYAFSDGLVLLVSPADYSAALGGRLVKIQDTPIEDVIAALGTAIAHANNGWLRVRAADSLSIAMLLYGLGIIPDMTQATFTFETPNGATVALDVSSMPRGQLGSLNWQSALDPAAVPAAFRSHNPPNYWYDYLADSGTLYIDYAICTEAASWPFADFMAGALAVLDAQPVERVVVDLRANSGGDSTLLEPLIDALAQRANINRAGHLFVLIGPRTFSSAVLNAIQFKQRTAAILLGEPTGSEPNHYGEVQSFTLPNSGLSVYYSTKQFVYIEGDHSSALQPDQVVPLTAADLLAGRDPVLAAAVAWK
jgi:hypothetical protein